MYNKNKYSQGEVIVIVKENDIIPLTFDNNPRFNFSFPVGEKFSWHITDTTRDNWGESIFLKWNYTQGAWEHLRYPIEFMDYIMSESEIRDSKIDKIISCE
jgi:hypothetical protein